MHPIAKRNTLLFQNQPAPITDMWGACLLDFRTRDGTTYKVRGNQSQMLGGKYRTMTMFTNNISDYFDNRPTGVANHVGVAADPVDASKTCWDMAIRNADAATSGSMRTEIAGEGQTLAEYSMPFRKRVFICIDYYLDTFPINGKVGQMLQFHLRPDGGDTDPAFSTALALYFGPGGGDGTGHFNPDTNGTEVYVYWDTAASTGSGAGHRETYFLDGRLPLGVWQTFIFEWIFDWQVKRRCKLWWDKGDGGGYRLALDRVGYTQTNDALGPYPKFGNDYFYYSSGPFPETDWHWYSHGLVILDADMCHNDYRVAANLYADSIKTLTGGSGGKQLTLTTAASTTLDSPGPTVPTTRFTVFIDQLKITDWTPALLQSICSQWNTTGNHRAWNLYLNSGTGGLFGLDISTAGTAINATATITTKPGFADNSSVVDIAFEWDGNNFSGYRRHQGSTTYVSAGKANAVAAGPFFPQGTANLQMGGINQGGANRASYTAHAMRLYSGLYISRGPGDCSLLASVDMQDWAAGATFVSGGHTYTLRGSAAIA